VVVIFGKNQRLGHLGPSRKELRQAVAVGCNHRPDLAGAGHPPVQFRRVVGKILVQLLPTLAAGAFILHPHPPALLNGAALLGNPGANAVHLAIHIHPISHRPLAGIFHHQVLIEKAKGLLAGGGGQPDQVGIEIFQHLPPEVVNGAVAFIGDDEIVIFNRQPGVVGHRLLGLAAQRRLRLPQRALLVGSVKLSLARKHRKQPLDGGDVHLADIIQHIGLEMLHVVQLGKFASIIGGDKLVKLLERLPPQVVAVHQKEHALRPGVLDQPVDEIDRRKGLAAARRHLNQRPRAVRRKRLLQVGDCLYLRRPQIGGEQRKLLWHFAQASPQRIGLGQPISQRLRAVKSKNPP